MNPDSNTKKRNAVSLRAILIALAIIPFNSYWIYMAESVKYTGHPTCMSIFFNAVTILFLMVGVNGILRRRLPGAVFSQGELITIYVMVALASVPPSHDMLQVLIPGMVYPQLFGTAEDGWSQQFMERMPEWLMVRNQAAIKGFFSGGVSLYDPEIIGAWLIPATVWMIFILTMIFVLGCLTVLLRKQWTEHEKLTYPLVQIPLEMTSEKTPMFKSWMLWAGFAVAAGLDIAQGMHMLFPSIPDLGLKTVDFQTMLKTRPWSAAGWWPFRFYPFAVGLGAILPVDLSFSLWFFYLFSKLQLVTSAALGYDTIPRFPYLNEQAFGSIIGVFVFSVWTGRRYWFSMARGIVKGISDGSDSGEAMRYRTAAAGALAGTLAMMLFARMLGMSPWVVIVFYLIFFAMCIAQTRMRAELGPPVHDFWMIGPDSMLPAMIGSATLGPANLMALTTTFWFNRSYRSLAMPIQLEAFKMSETAGISYRKLFGAMMLAVAAGTITGFWAELHVANKIGAFGAALSPKWFALEPYTRLSSWMNAPAASNVSIIAAVSAGFGFTLLLNTARMRLGWFPFHPVGYALSGNWSMNMLWFSLILAWLTKLMILRYGGLKLYRQVFPFFIGLILGEFVMGSVWSLFGIAAGIQTYNIFP